jgi:fatty-acyl-CoA synthase
LLHIGSLRSPEAAAIHYFSSGDELGKAVTVSHRELFENVTRTANLLSTLGIGPTDVVGILMPITPESQYAIWGSEAAGIACPINWMLEPEIIRNLLIAAGAKAVIVYGPDQEIEAWNKVLLIRGELPNVRHLIKAGGGPVDTSGVIDLLSAIPSCPGDRLISGRRFQPDQVASLFHTGGTTGTPKLAQQTHANVVFTAWMTSLQFDLQPTDVRVCGVPMFHVTGVITSCLMPLARGAAVVLLTPSGWRNPSVLRNIWRIIERFRVTTLGLVPSVVNMLLNVPTENADLSSLKTVTCGTAPLAVAVAEAFARHSGARIMEGYGLTEGTALSASNPRYGEPRTGSIGLRIAYQEMKVVKIESGAMVRDCEVGEPGAIVIRGPNIFKGYLNSEKTKGAFLDGGWFHTGDLGYMDAQGYFWITGRAKDLIIRGGHNIDPRLIEEALYRHPAVLDAAAVGIPDAHAGELPVAYVALKPGANYPLGRLRHYAYEAIPERAAVPKHIYLMEAIPKTAVGKIRKNELRRKAIHSAQQQLIADSGLLAVRKITVEDKGDSGLHSTITLPAFLDAEARSDAEREIRVALAPLTVKYEIVYE